MYAETVVWLWYGKIKTGSHLYSHMLGCMLGNIKSFEKRNKASLINAYKFGVEHFYMLQK